MKIARRRSAEQPFKAFFPRALHDALRCVANGSEYLFHSQRIAQCSARGNEVLVSVYLS